MATFGYCLFPMLCIWFPDAMGLLRWAGNVRESPPSIVFLLGWVTLLLPFLLVVLQICGCIDR